MQRNTENKISRKGILLAVSLLLLTGIFCVLVYKAQIRENLNKPLEYTMMTEHKEVSRLVLSGEEPWFSEVFMCKVPQLQKISIECTGKNVTPGAMVLMTLMEEETGNLLYEEKKPVGEMLNARIKKKVEMKLPAPVKESEGKRLRLTWTLENPGKTTLSLTANQKPVLVESGINVIYYLHYGSAGSLKPLYGALCAALLVTMGLAGWMILIRRTGVERFFLPLALMLGLIFQCLFTVGSIPDEQTHLDTAYKYSNKMLFTEDTGNPWTLRKRVCDVEMCEMLTNGLETNSHYQLMTETFQKPEDTSLMEVPGLDASSLVPGITYFPAAAGISLGRVLGLSPMLTFQLGRIFNLLAFSLLAWSAICLIPCGKNLLGMIALLPITLQQGASASYDAVVNGVLLVLTAMAVRMGRENQKKNWEMVVFALLVLFTVMTKGGVYIPLLLLFVFALRRRTDQKKDRKKTVRWLLVGGGAVILLAGLCIWKFLPVVETFLQTGGETLDGTGMYTIPYLITHPLKTVYLYWNALMKRGDFYLQGLLGGLLSWLDYEMSWLFGVIFLICLLLMANVDGDRLASSVKQKVWMALICAASIGLIMMSMLVGYTRNDLNYIQGVQGRYFLPLAPVLFFLTSTEMVHVKKEQSASIWMTMLTAEVLLILQVAAMTGIV